MIEIRNTDYRLVLIAVSEIAYVKQEDYRDCSIHMRNGDVIYTDSISYKSLIKEIKEAKK